MAKSFEIEKKYLVKELPRDYEKYPCRHMAQGYLNTDPVVRIRKSDDEYYLTYKGKGLMVREEYNLPLTQQAFEHMLPKIDGILIEKVRYEIPVEGGYTAELDIFKGRLTPLCLVEVEFKDEKDANEFVPPEWFGEDVTFSNKYHNSVLSQRKE